MDEIKREKRCKRCLELKPLTEFHKQHNSRRAICRACSSEVFAADEARHQRMRDRKRELYKIPAEAEKMREVVRKSRRKKQEANIARLAALRDHHPSAATEGALPEQ